MKTRKVLLASLLTACSNGALATAPSLYSLPSYQSPVRANADDLLMLPGHGFAATDVVVYVALTDTTLPLSTPASVPATDTAATGTADVVSTANAQHSLTIRLPQAMTNHQSYALWVQNSLGEWSNGVRINDARPLWFTPSRLTASGPVASLTRYLRVVGRNLQPAAGQTTRVRLTEPTTYTLTAANDGQDDTTCIMSAITAAKTAGGGRVMIAREYWQTYTVDNISDHRTPLCLKSNRVPTPSTPIAGGTISVWGQTTDSALEGNRLYDSTGIMLQHTYKAEESGCPTCISGHSFQNFVEVRGNTLDHEYDWSTDCSRAGIFGSHGASNTPTSPPPVAGYGATIAHNVIDQSNGYTGGAITYPLTWFGGSTPNNWKLINNTLMHHNQISNLPGTLNTNQCSGHLPASRRGIHLQNPLVWNTVLYANSCTNVAQPLKDAGSATVRVCPSPAANFMRVSLIG